MTKNNNGISRQAAFVIIKRDNKVLLVRSKTNPKYSKYWGPPGGVVENGEALKVAAKREAIEETNITCKLGDQLSCVFNREGEINVYVFAGEYITGEIRIDRNEIEEAKWFELNEAIILPLAFNTKTLIHKIAKQ